MIEVKIEAINKDSLNLDDIFSEIAKKIHGVNSKKKQSLEDMKKDLEMHNKMASALLKKIKEEELRKKKEENHLIEKREKTTVISNKILFGTNKKEYKTVNVDPLETKEVIKYVRKGNQIVCTITNEMGEFKGIAIQHPDDKFNYKSGMMLALVRANKDMCIKTEESLINQM